MSTRGVLGFVQYHNTNMQVCTFYAHIVKPSHFVSAPQASWQNPGAHMQWCALMFTPSYSPPTTARGSVAAMTIGH